MVVFELHSLSIPEGPVRVAGYRDYINEWDSVLMDKSFFFSKSTVPQKYFI